jgi:hypothetical protein
MFGHDYITDNAESVSGSDRFECLLEDIAVGSGVQESLTLVATKGDEVKVTGLLVSLQVCGHLFSRSGTNLASCGRDVTRSGVLDA